MHMRKSWGPPKVLLCIIIEPGAGARLLSFVDIPDELQLCYFAL